MATRDADHILRKKLQACLREILMVGTLRGFKYFSLYVRGKEELIVSVVNEPSKSSGTHNVSDNLCPVSPGIMPSSPMIRQENIIEPRVAPLPQPSASFTSTDIPYDQNKLLLSQTTQLKLSGYGDEGVGLPPASPSDQENTLEDSNVTLFLLASYSRYGSPYVWVRSNHDRLVKMGREMDTKDKDSPLKLKSTSNWRKEDLHIWDILIEVVRLCSYPAPQNPLAIDFSYLRDIPTAERLLLSGSLLYLLEQVILNSDDDKYFVGPVLEDYKQLTSEHMKTLNEMFNPQEVTGIPPVIPALQTRELARKQWNLKKTTGIRL